MCMKRIDINGEVANPSVGKPHEQKKMSIGKAHGTFCHCSEDMTRKTAKVLGIELARGSLDPCVACTAGKAKQKNVPKLSEHVPSTENNGRIYLDIATIKKTKNGPKVTKPNWCVIVDERTGLKFLSFHQTKGGMVEPTCEKLHRWKEAGHAVKHTRLDNAGENKKLKARSNSADWKLNINLKIMWQNLHLQFWLTAAEPQCTPLMCHWRHDTKVFREAFQTATLVDGLMPVDIGGVIDARNVHWSGSNPSFAKHLRTWGKAGTAKLKIKASPKITDGGVQCMFVGYAIDHDGDCHRMWDPKTRRVHKSRDIIWLYKMFFQEKLPASDLGIEPINYDITGMEAREGNDLEEDTSSDEEEEKDDDDDDGAGAAPIRAAIVEEPAVTRSGRAVNPPARFIEEIGATAGDYEIGLTASELGHCALMRDFPEGEFAPGEVACVGAGLGGSFEHASELHVMKFKTAVATKDRQAWEVAVQKEHQ
jgi:hypothetical protein